MKTNYVNIQGAILYGVPPKKLEKLRRKVNKSFEHLNIAAIYPTYQEGRNAIAAINRNEVIGWIDFENIEDIQQIHSIDILPEYLNEGIVNDLIEQAVYELKNEKPSISIPINMIEYFKPSIEKYGWEYTSYTIYSNEEFSRGYNEYEKQQNHNIQRKKQIK